MVYVLLADGFEEIEAFTPVDILRRCGADVLTAGVYGKTVRGSHGITVLCDILISEADKSKMSLLLLPGGPGHTLLDESAEVHALIDYAVKNNIRIAAICAAPSILGKRGLLIGRKATCFPGYEKDLHGAEICDAPVASDGIFFTGKGAGAAAEFGFLVAAAEVGEDEAARVKAVMQY